MYFVDINSGIGGMRSGLERAGHTCIATMESDKMAIAIQQQLFKGATNYETFKGLSNDYIRLFERCGIVSATLGQDFTNGGNRYDGINSGMFAHVLQTVEELQPRYVLLESIHRTLSHFGGFTFGRIIGELQKLGYIVEWGVLNGKHFGTPQSSERLFILGTKEADFKRVTLLPVHLAHRKVRQNIHEFLEWDVCERYYLTEKQNNAIVEKFQKEINSKSYPIDGFSLTKDKQAYALTTSYGNPTVIGHIERKFRSLVVEQFGGEVVLRNFTTSEAARLGGFTEKQNMRIHSVDDVTDAQLYKFIAQTPNPNVVSKIGSLLK